ncbi:probable trehalose-phosphate phosphatase 6 [Zingiber officinale]|uniref:probable trehalose-phosphate phosphatase 6 n=1 Tax=Zingiber officinale TaxID=94328 RepID=UPI001C4BB87A|nr:probable trehalose-phosphate phosphatase 6 [Zingiber officinale]
MVKQSVIVPEEIAISGAASAAKTEPPVLLPAFPPRNSIPGLHRASFNNRFMSQVDISGGRPSALVESMRASSPTHPREAASDLSVAADGEYKDWLKRHPSALGNFNDVVAASKAKQMVMFLDYDGTLSPIVDDPDSAFMSEPMREAVRDVARHFPTAIVSGRCRNKVFNFVRLKELYYAGSHGMDIKGPSKSTKKTTSKTNPVLFQPASEFLPVMDEVYNALVEKIKSVPGSRVENNTFSLSVHYRCVEEKIWNSLAELVRSVVNDYPELRLTVGRKVLEIRPSIEWDKGKALEFLLESIGFANCNNVFPVYIGDDRTDEDAFKVLRERGQGVGILVSKFAKETNASYSLQEPAEVNKFLRQLVAWKKLLLKE